MQPVLQPRHYRDQEILNVEHDALFSNCWIFAGFKSDLPNDGDWITVSVGLASVIVQNSDGNYNAFLNVCSHRFSRICIDDKGSGALRCPYHGWQYNQDGLPSAIPRKPRFPDLTESKVRELALKRYAVESCGEILFVRRNAGGPPLKEYLAETYALLEAIGNSIGAVIDESRQTVNANWKINVENTLEAYHVSSVHPNTFGKTGHREIGFRFAGVHSGVHAEFSPKMNASWNAIKAKFTTVYPLEGYCHWFIFPNLLIAGSYGLTFNFSTFTPQTASAAVFRNRLCQVRLVDDNPTANMVLQPMLESIKDFNRQVFSEDVGICEQVQRGVNEANGPGILSDEEARVCAFQNAYLEHLGSAKIAATTEAR